MGTQSRWRNIWAGILVGVGFGLTIAAFNSVLLVGLNPRVAGIPDTPFLLGHILLVSVFAGMAAGFCLSLLWTVFLLVAKDLPHSSHAKGIAFMLGAILFAVLYGRALMRNLSFFSTPSNPTMRASMVLLLAGSSVLAVLLFLAAYRLGSSARGRLRVPIAGFSACLLIVIGGFTTIVWPNPGAVPAEATVTDDLQGAATGEARPKVFLIGLDGADWDIIDQLMADGKLPNFKVLIENGARANLKAIIPTKSPIVWTSIATGMTPEQHGINNFVSKRFSFTTVNIKDLELPNHAGFGEVVDIAQFLGLLERTPASSHLRRSNALWNMLSAANRASIVIGWWASWPAERIRGIMVSDRVNYARIRALEGIGRARNGLTYPESFLEGIHGLIVQPEQVSAGEIRQFLDVDEQEAKEIMSSEYEDNVLRSEFTYLLSQDRTYANIAKHCLDTLPQPDLFAVYFRGVDIVSHCALQYCDLLHDPEADREDVARFGGAVGRYYAFTDKMLGELLEKLEKETTIVVVSDHGFVRVKPGTYGHSNAPDGVFLISGPEILPGARIETPSIYDVAPTVLYLLNLPVAEDMQGRVLRDCVRPERREVREAKTIPTYGTRKVLPSTAADRRVEGEMIEHLRALGYLN